MKCYLGSQIKIIRSVVVTAGKFINTSSHIKNNVYLIVMFDHIILR